MTIGAIAGDAGEGAAIGDVNASTIARNLFQNNTTVGLWIGGFDILYSMQDVEADRRLGLHSIPARYGIRWARWFAAAFHVGTVICLLAVPIMVPELAAGYMAALMPAEIDRSGGYGGFFDVLLADQVREDLIDDVVAATVAAGSLGGKAAMLRASTTWPPMA